MKLSNKEASEWLIAIKRDYIYGGDEDYDERRKLALDMGAEALENQKTGHWVVDLQNTIGGLYKCSECGRRIYLFREDNLSENYPYCHCGAKMEGENKDNWFAEMEESEKHYEHKKWVESLEKGEQE